MISICRKLSRDWNNFELMISICRKLSRDWDLQKKNSTLTQLFQFFINCNLENLLRLATCSTEITFLCIMFCSLNDLFKIFQKNLQNLFLIARMLKITSLQQWALRMLKFFHKLCELNIAKFSLAANFHLATVES